MTDYPEESFEIINREEHFFDEIPQPVPDPIEPLSQQKQEDILLDSDTYRESELLQVNDDDITLQGQLAEAIGDITDGNLSTETSVDDYIDKDSDGNTVKKTVTTVRYFENTNPEEKRLVGTDVKEVMYILPPGVAEPDLDNIVTSTTTDEQQLANDGTWIKKSQTMVACVTKEVPPKPVIEEYPGEMDTRIHEENLEDVRDDGTKIKRRIVVVTHFQIVTKHTVIDNVEKTEEVEKPMGTEILETVTELGPGVEDEDADGTMKKKSEKEEEETQEDGTWLRKKTVTTIVSLMEKPDAPEGEEIPVDFEKDEGKFVDARDRDDMLDKGEEPEPVVQEIPGDVESRTEESKSEHTLDDGTKVKTKCVTKKCFQLITIKKMIDDVEDSEVIEKPVGTEVVEDIVELAPGVESPEDPGVATKITEKEEEETLADGTWVKRKVTTTTCTLVSRKVSPEPKEDHPGTESEGVIKEVEYVSTETMQEPEPAIVGDEQVPTVEEYPGEMDTRIHEENLEDVRDDGTKVKRKIVVVTHFQIVTRRTVIDNVEKTEEVEKPMGTEILETITELGPGVEDEDADGTMKKKSEKEEEETQEDGTWLRKKTVTTIVSLMEKPISPDASKDEDIPVDFEKDEGKFVDAVDTDDMLEKVEEPEPVVQEIPGDVESRTEESESEHTLDDGTKVKTKCVTKKCFQLVTIKKMVDDVEESEVIEKPVGTEVLEDTVELAPGVESPEDPGVATKITEKEEEETLADGTWVKRKVTTTTCTLVSREVSPEPKEDHPGTESEEVIKEVEYVSTETMQEPEPAIVDEQVPTVVEYPGEMDTRIHEENLEDVRDDGTKIKRRIVVVTHFQIVTKHTVIDNVEKIEEVEKPMGTEILETVTELGPGVEDEDADGTMKKKSEKEEEETQEDGTWLRKKTVTTIVSLMEKPISPDASKDEDIPVDFEKDEGKFVDAVDIDNMLEKVEEPEPVVQEIPGDVESRTEESESEHTLDDGTKVKTKCVTKKCFQLVTIKKMVDDVEDSEVIEKPVGTEVVEDTVELAPGVESPEDPGVATKITEKEEEETLADGTWVKRKVTTTTCTLVSREVSPKPKEDHPGTESEEVIKEVEYVSTETMQEPEPAIVDEQVPTVEEYPGEMDTRIHEENLEDVRDDGTKVMRKIVVVTHFQLVTRRTVIDNVEKTEEVEKPMGTEILETITELGPGVEDEDADGTMKKKSEKEEEETQEDGTWLRKKTVTTIVSLMEKPISPDASKDEDIPVDFEKDKGKFVDALDTDDMLERVEKPEPVVQEIPGDVESRTEESESEHTLDDGTKVKTKCVTKKCFQLVTIKKMVDDVEDSEVIEKPVGTEVVEDTVELAPGVESPEDPGVATKITEKEEEETLADGTWIKRKVTTTTCTLVSREVSPEPKEDHPGTESEEVIKEVEYVSTETMQEPEPAIVDEQVPTVEEYPGEMDTRIHEENLEDVRDDGTKIKRRIVVVTHFQIVTKHTVIDNVEKTEEIEKPMGTEILETVTELGPGVEDEDADGTMKKKSEKEEEETQEDGTWLRKKTVTTIVSLMEKPISPDASKDEDIPVDFEKDEGKFVDAVDIDNMLEKVEEPEPVVQEIPGDVESRTEESESEHTLDDGTKVKTKCVTKKCFQLVTIKKMVDDVEDSEVIEKPVGTEVVEDTVELAPGVESPEDPGVATKITEKEEEETLADGTWVKRKVTTTTCTLVSREVSPEPKEDHPGTESEEVIKEVEYVSTETMQEPEPAIVDEQVPTVEEYPGEMDTRIHEENLEDVRDDGTKVMRKIVVVTHFQLVTRRTVIDNVEKTEEVEKPMGTEILETITELGPGVEDEDADGTMKKKSEKEEEETQEDGTWLRKKTVTTIVSLMEKPISPDASKDEDIPVDFEKDEGKFVDALDTDDMLERVEKPEPVVQEIPGDVESRTEESESEHTLDDGTKVKTKCVTKKCFQLVTIKKMVDDMEDSEVTEKPVGTEIVEDTVELAPGVESPEDPGVATKITEKEEEETLADGTWVKRKVTTTTCTLVSREVSPEPKEDHPGTESEEVIKEVEYVSAETMQEPEPAIVADEQVPTVEEYPGEMDTRIHEENLEDVRDDGTKVKRKIVVVTHFQLVTRHTVIDNVEKTEEVEKPMGTEILETVTELGPGVEDEDADGTMKKKSEKEEEETQEDGTWLRKKTVTTIVSLMEKPDAPEGEEIPVQFEKDEGKFVDVRDTDEMLDKGEEPEPVVQEIPGDVESRTEESKSEHTLDDGTKVKTKCVTKKCFQLITIKKMIDDVEDSEVIEKPVGTEVVEDIVELAPGVESPEDPGVATKITEKEEEETLADGTWVKRKVTTTTCTLVSREVSPEPKEDHPGTESEEVIKEVEYVSTETMQKPEPAIVGDDQVPTVEEYPGEMDTRIHEENLEDVRDDGTKVKRKIVVVTHFQLVTKRTVIDNVEKTEEVEEPMGTEILETVTELGPGVEDEDADGTMKKKSEKEEEETQEDGTWLRKKTVTTIVSLMEKPISPDASKDEDIPVDFEKDEGKFVDAVDIDNMLEKVEEPEPVVQEIPGDVESRTEESESEHTLDDGTKVKTKCVTKKCFQLVTIKKMVDDVEDSEVIEKPVGTEVVEDTVELAPGVESPEDPGVATKITEKEEEETLADGTWVKRKVTTTTCTLVSREVSPEPKEDHPGTESEGVIKEVEYVSAETMQEPEPAIVGDEQVPTVEEYPGEMDTRIHEENFEDVRDDGTKVKRKIVVVTHFQLVTRRTVIDNVEKTEEVEKPMGTEILETVTELGPGVEDEDADGTMKKKSEKEEEETQEDGTWLRKKTITTIVSLMEKPISPDTSKDEDIPVDFEKDEGKFVDAVDTDDMLEKVEEPEPVVQEIPGDVESRTEESESEHTLDDGTKVKTKCVTKKCFQLVTIKKMVDDVEDSEVIEKPVGTEVVEDTVELAPGVESPEDPGVATKITEKEEEETLADGTWVKRKVTTTTCTLVSREVSPEPKEDHPGTESEEVIKEVEYVSTETMQKPEPAIVGDEQVPTVEEYPGEMDTRIHEENVEDVRDDGTKVKRKIVVVTHFQLVTRHTVIDNVEKTEEVEKPMGTEILETVTELGPGVEDEDADGTMKKKSEKEEEETQEDGTWLRKKTVTTIVSLMEKPISPDASKDEDIPVDFEKDEGKFVNAVDTDDMLEKVEEPEPVVQEIPGDVESRTEESESEHTLDDGTKVKTKCVTKKCFQLVTIKKMVDDVEDSEVIEKPVGTEVVEDTVELAPGVESPEDPGVATKITEKEEEETLADGTWVKRKVTTTTCTLVSREVSPEPKEDHPGTESEEVIKEVEYVSTETMQEPEPAIVADEQVPSVEEYPGEMDTRIHEENLEDVRDDGTKVKRKIVVVTHFQLVTRHTVIDNVEKTEEVEKPMGTEILETVTELRPGVEDEDADGTMKKKSEKEEEETQEDGTWLRKKTVTTIVSLMEKPISPDASKDEDIPVDFEKDEGKFVDAVDIDNMLEKVEEPEPVVQEIPGDVESRTEESESEHTLDDGTKVKTKCVTKKCFQLVTIKKMVDDVEDSEVIEKPVGTEVVEDTVELAPGVESPEDPGVATKITEKEEEETLADGTWVKRKVTTTTCTLVSREVSPEPKEDHPGTESEEVIKEVEYVSAETMQEPEPAIVADEQVPTVEEYPGEMDTRIHEENLEDVRDDGTKVKRKIVVVTHFQLVTRHTVIDNVEKTEEVEKPMGTEILETVTELGPGVEDEDADGTMKKKSEKEEEETQEDGTWLRKKTVTTIVSLMEKPDAPEGEEIPVQFEKDEGKFVDVRDTDEMLDKGEEPEPVVQEIPGDVESRTEESKSEHTLDDGTKVKTKCVTKKCFQLITIKKMIDDVEDSEVIEKPVGTEVVEDIVELAPGVESPEDPGVATKITEKEEEETLADGTWVKRKVTTTTCTLVSREVSPEPKEDHPGTESEEVIKEVEYVSTETMQKPEPAIVGDDQVPTVEEYPGEMDTRIHEENLEDVRDDGTKVKRKIVVVTHFQLVTKRTVIDNVEKTEEVEEPMGTEILETVTELGPGVEDEDADGTMKKKSEKEEEETQEDGTWLRKKTVTTIVSLMEKPISPDASKDEDIPVDFEKDEGKFVDAIDTDDMLEKVEEPEPVVQEIPGDVESRTEESESEHTLDDGTKVKTKCVTKKCFQLVTIKKMVDDVEDSEVIEKPVGTEVVEDTVELAPGVESPEDPGVATKITEKEEEETLADGTWVKRKVTTTTCTLVSREVSPEPKEDHPGTESEEVIKEVEYVSAETMQEPEPAIVGDEQVPTVEEYPGEMDTRIHEENVEDVRDDGTKVKRKIVVVTHFQLVTRHTVIDNVEKTEEVEKPMGTEILETVTELGPGVEDEDADGTMKKKSEKEEEETQEDGTWLRKKTVTTIVSLMEKPISPDASKDEDIPVDFEKDEGKFVNAVDTDDMLEKVEEPEPVVQEIPGDVESRTEESESEHTLDDGTKVKTKCVTKKCFQLVTIKKMVDDVEDSEVIEKPVGTEVVEDTVELAPGVESPEDPGVATKITEKEEEETLADGTWVKRKVTTTTCTLVSREVSPEPKEDHPGTESEEVIKEVEYVSTETMQEPEPAIVADEQVPSVEEYPGEMDTRIHEENLEDVRDDGTKVKRKIVVVTHFQLVTRHTVIDNVEKTEEVEKPMGTEILETVTELRPGVEDEDADGTMKKKSEKEEEETQEDGTWLRKKTVTTIVSLMEKPISPDASKDEDIPVDFEKDEGKFVDAVDIDNMLEKVEEPEPVVQEIPGDVESRTEESESEHTLDDGTKVKTKCVTKKCFQLVTIKKMVDDVEDSEVIEKPVGTEVVEDTVELAPGVESPEDPGVATKITEKEEEETLADGTWVKRKVTTTTCTLVSREVSPEPKEDHPGTESEEVIKEVEYVSAETMQEPEPAIVADEQVPTVEEYPGEMDTRIHEENLEDVRDDGTKVKRKIVVVTHFQLVTRHTVIDNVEKTEEVEKPMGTEILETVTELGPGVEDEDADGTMKKKSEKEEEETQEDGTWLRKKTVTTIVSLMEKPDAPEGEEIPVQFEKDEGKFVDVRDTDEMLDKGEEPEPVVQEIPGDVESRTEESKSEHTLDDGTKVKTKCVTKKCFQLITIKKMIDDVEDSEVIEKPVGTEVVEDIVELAPGVESPEDPGVATKITEKEEEETLADGTWVKRKVTTTTCTLVSREVSPEPKEDHPGTESEEVIKEVEYVSTETMQKPEPAIVGDDQVPTVEEYPGEMDTRIHEENLEDVRDDGTKVKRKIVVVTHFQLVTKRTVIDNVEKTEEVEEPMGTEILETVTELGPGVEDEDADGTMKKKSEKEEEETQEDGTWLRKKTVTTIVSLMEKPISPDASKDEDIPVDFEKDEGKFVDAIDTDDMLEKVEEPEPVVQEIPGDVESRTEESESEHTLDDGTKVKTKCVTKKCFQLVTIKKMVDDVEDSEVIEKPVGTEVVEDTVELAPGVESPEDPGVATKITEKEEEETLADGTWVKRKVTTTTCTLVSREVSPEPKEDHPGTESEEVIKEVEYVSAETMQEPEPAIVGDEQVPTVEEYPGEMDTRIHEENVEDVRDDGTKVKRKIVVVTHFQLVTRHTVIDNVEKTEEVEKPMGTEILETVTELGPGVEDEDADGTMKKRSEKEEEETQEDGTWLRKKTVTTIVSLMEKPISPDASKDEDIPVDFEKDEGKFVDAVDTDDMLEKVEEPEPVVQEIPGDVESRTEESESEHTLDDGTKVKTKCVTKKCFQLVTIKKMVDDVEESELIEKPVGTEVVEDTVELAPGVESPEDPGVATKITEKEEEETLADGTWVKRKVTTTTCTLVSREVSPEPKEDHPGTESEGVIKEVEYVSAETMQEPEPAIVGDEQVPTVEEYPGEMDTRIHEENLEDVRDDGTKVQRRIVVVTHFQIVTRCTVIDNVEKTEEVEKPMGTEILETVTELGPGVEDEDADGTMKKKSEKEEEETQEDGTWLRKKTVTTIVSLMEKPISPDASKDEDIPVDFEKDEGKFVDAVDTDDMLKVEKPEPVVQEIPGDVESRTEESKSEHTLDDGTKVKTKCLTKKYFQMVSIKKIVDDTEDSDIIERPVGTEVVEDIVELAPGVESPQDPGVATKTTETEEDKTLDDGTWMKRKVITRVYTLIPRSVSPESDNILDMEAARAIKIESQFVDALKNESLERTDSLDDIVVVNQQVAGEEDVEAKQDFFDVSEGKHERKSVCV